MAALRRELKLIGHDLTRLALYMMLQVQKFELKIDKLTYWIVYYVGAKFIMYMYYV